MTKLRKNDTTKSRYLEMAAAAAKGAQEARSARDRAVYLALAKGWEGLAADSGRTLEKPKPGAKAKKKPKRGGGA